MTKKTEVDRLVAYTVQQYGGLDILIANAGEPLPFLSPSLALGRGLYIQWSCSEPPALGVFNSVIPMWFNQSP